MKVLEAPLDAISREARPYPAYLLDGCETGLCLFAAAFLGHNDAIHMARAEMTVACVDVDGPRLREMRDLFPADWLWYFDDAWGFAQEAKLLSIEWDAVSVDTFTGDAERRSLDSLELWCSLARKVVTVTHCAGSEYVVPDGWQDGLFERATGVNWLVLTR